MGDSIGLLLLLQVVLIALNAVFASAEIAVISVNDTKMERLAEEGDTRAKRLLKLTQEPAKFLATIQVAITLSGFLGSAFAADNFSGPLVDWLVSLGVTIPRSTLSTIAVIVITLVLSYFTLIFGELVPKRIAMKKSEQLSMKISGLVSAISVAFKPIVWFLSVSTNLVLRLCGIDPTETEDEVSEEEIRMLVDAGSEKGIIAYQEKEFIQNVFEFDDINAGDIATHRTDVDILWMDDDLDAWAETIHDTRHTRYPVCDGSPDHVIGILNAKDYFRLEDKTKENIFATAVRPAYFVPETIKADVLFRNMKKTRHVMAVVMDEYGGMVGVVTLYDLVEELVGELNDEPDEFQAPEPHLEKTGENTWSVIGNVELSDVEEALGIEIETEEDIDTFTGLVFDELGMIPNEGAQNIDLEIRNMKIHVSSIAEHQIEAATIILKEEPKEADPEKKEVRKEAKGAE